MIMIAKIEKSGMQIFAYQSKSPMSVFRKFKGILESDTKRIKAQFYVGKGLCGYLLSWKTSQDLLQIVQPVTLNK